MSITKTSPTKIHGVWASYMPEYIIWTAMIKRCNNIHDGAFERYGGRGITVCDRWRGENGFLNFYADMGKRPHKYTVERIDNSKGYSPENCKWATYQEQSLNQRKRTDNRTGYTGVRWMPQYKHSHWGAFIYYLKEVYGLGRYGTIEEAALAYDCAAIQLHGEYAKLNLL